MFGDLLEDFLKEFAMNGRQVRFKSFSSSKPCPISFIEVIGKNQNNALETWNHYFEEPFPYLVETKDW